MNLGLNEAVLDAVWSIRPSSLVSVVRAAATNAAPVNPKKKLPRVDGPVAIIPLTGMITPRSSIWEEWFGGTSVQSFEAAFQRAISSELIKAVVIDCHSPGGVTYGVSLASDRVFAARGIKPIVAVCNYVCCSAAYWIASSAEQFVAAPSSDVGSLGVFRVHEDVSKMLEEEGIKVTMIATPKYKVEGNEFEPITEECLKHNMMCVEETYEQFIKAVARNRGVSAKQAKADYGEGRTFHAETALTMGMIDRVASMDQVLRELGVGTGTSTMTRAQSQAIEEELCHAWETGYIEVEPLAHENEQKAGERRATLLRLRQEVECGG